MAIIDFNTTPDRGTPTTVTLNKTELASLPSVANDSYFSDSSNWKKVVMVFKNDGENVQKETVYFDATQTTPTSKFDISPKSQGNFLIESILIQDFDGGHFQVLRDELNTADFDVNLDGEPPAYTRDFSDPAAYTAIESNSFNEWGSTYIDSAGYLDLFVWPNDTFNFSYSTYGLNTSTLGLTEERYYNIEIDYSTVITAKGANLTVFVGSYSSSVNINTLNPSGGTVTFNNLYKTDFDPDSLVIRLDVQGDGVDNGHDEIYITAFRIIPV
jgi:hypothetical protein